MAPRRISVRALALVPCALALASLAGWLFMTLEVGLADRVFVEPVSSRSYRVLTRADHDPSQPTPVLFGLHAYATAPEVLVRAHWLKLLAVRKRGIILVLPEGKRDARGHYAWNATHACCGAGSARPDDLAYLRQVLADVERRYAVDPTRVMALGVSNGAFMAQRWACSAGARLTAIASISGTGPGPEDAPCTPSTPVSILQIHGEADATIHYGGGRMRDADYPSALASLTPFMRIAGSQREPRTRMTRGVLVGAIRKQEWPGGRARIALWTVPGGEHNLRTAQLATPEILDFLAGSP